LPGITPAGTRQFRRVDIGDPDLLAIASKGIAIVDENGRAKGDGG